MHRLSKTQEASWLLIAVVWCAAALQAEPLGDKTLVAWVYPADVTQRGGSAVTLMEGEDFDAIVLGERVQGRWMAGSDFFRRTQAEAAQEGNPPESAGPDTCVQVAIAYAGTRISIFRDGRPYADSTVTKARPFGEDAAVLLGLRYLGDMGEIGFFLGAIEEARIYSVALDAGQIAALAPGRASVPAPLACWTFEDGRADDVMRTFPATRLEGSARIAGGKLVLDGGGYLWAARKPRAPEVEVAFEGGVQTLFYKARSPRTGIMWDTWLYRHEGTYYLYYLARARGQWDNISMASSPDGVHWKELGRVLSKGRGVTWMGTGSTWKSPSYAQDGKLQLNFSEWKGPRQTIFFAESPDGLAWTRLGAEYEFVQDERWYERNGRWDCIWTVARPGGGLYGYWTATPKAATGGRFGFGESLDGVRWQALPPPKVEGVGEGEVGAIEKLGARYYMMFGTGGLMVTLVADRPEGPFRAAGKNFRLLAGHTYFARFFPLPEAVLVNHHSIARDGQVYFGTLKSAVLDAEGTLRLGWWQGNEKLKGPALEVGMPALRRETASAPAMLACNFDANAGIILEGVLRLPVSTDAPLAGLFLPHGATAACAILVRAGGVVEIGPIGADGAGFTPEQRVDREWQFGAKARFRLLLKGSLLEFYLGDLLMHCHSLPAPASGSIGLLPGGDVERFENLRAWSPDAP